LIICSIISIATGSLGQQVPPFALIGVGGALGFDLGMVAEQLFWSLFWRQIISYNTTNLACNGWYRFVYAHQIHDPNNYTNLRYHLIIFIFLGLSVEINGNVNIATLSDIEASPISPWLFLVP
jgi:NhaC family Na+:H+ antiporter